MCRLVGWVSDRPTTLREQLGPVAVERLLHLSTVHCHGWGLAWRDGDELRTLRSPRQASEDPDFADVLDSVSTTAALVHLRMGTPGFGHAVSDTHPFRDGRWALAHNGAVSPAERVDALLPPGAASAPHGSTDSERWFLALRHAYDTATVDHAGPADRLAAAVAVVRARAAAVGLTASSWNSLLLGPDGLSVINIHDDTWQPGDIVVWAGELADPERGWPPYFDLRVRERDGARVVVSSGVVEDTDGWTLLANPSVLVLPFDGGPATSAAVPVGPARRAG